MLTTSTANPEVISPGKDDASESVATLPLIIDNKAQLSSISFPVHNPATGTLVHHFSSATLEISEDALRSASGAYVAWRDVPVPQKRDIFLRAAAIIRACTAAFVTGMMRETGCTTTWADFNVLLTAEILTDVAGRMGSIHGTIPVIATAGTSALVYREPYGTVLAIVPWNAAYILSARAVAYPLAAGNTVILKASELAPGCALALVRTLHEAGLPPGVLNLLAHRREDAAAITAALIGSPVVQKINFTGSTAVGRIIAAMAGQHLKPVVLELGGKAPAVVCEDADLQLAATQCAVGAFLNSGQVCMSTERILVHERIFAVFESLFREAVARFVSPGQRLVLINRAGVEKTMKLVQDAVAKGAQVSVVGNEADHGNPDSAGMRPIILSRVTSAMDIYYTESFGPTVSLLTVTSDEHAIALANDTEYGLSAAVFSRDLARALRIARRLESGAVHINGMTVHDEPALPHGGVKASGYGRFGSLGMEEWVRTKTVTYKD